MKMPEVRAQRYDTNIDAEINSKLLRTIFEDVLGLRYDPKRDSFVLLHYDHTGIQREVAWGIRIFDQHDNEIYPHYILEVGSGEYRNARSNCVLTSMDARYCDYHSYLSKIETDPGKWTIQVWLPADFDAESIIWNISNAYKKAMDEALPDYEILCSGALTKSEEELDYVPLN